MLPSAGDYANLQLWPSFPNNHLWKHLLSSGLWHYWEMKQTPQNEREDFVLKQIHKLFLRGLRGGGVTEVIQDPEEPRRAFF